MRRKLFEKLMGSEGYRRLRFRHGREPFERPDESGGKILPLSKLKVNQKGKVAYLRTNDRRRLQKVMAMGILPGMTVTLLQKFPSYIFQVGNSQFAVDKELAEVIFLQVADQKS